MALPHQFANQTAGNVPASYLDDNFSAVGTMGALQCTASGTNTVALTPNSNMPSVSSYSDWQLFSFKAVATSTGAVTINVNSVGAQNLYLQDGLTQATGGALTSGILYLIAYNSALNGGAGGFQIVSGGAAALMPGVPVEAFGAVGDGATDDAAAFQAAVTAMGGAPILLGNKTYVLGSGITASTPICLIGIGSGAGPGAAAQATSNVSRILLKSSTAYAFTITSEYPSIFRNIAFNVDSASQPMTAGGGIYIEGSGTATVGGEISNCAFNNLYDGVKVLRPFYPHIVGNYFGGWVHAGVYLLTSSGVEGAGGFLTQNKFYGTSGSTTQGACILTEVGYIHIFHNWMLGASIGAQAKYANHDAGETRIVDNIFENQGDYAIDIETSDGSLANMVTLSRNEFSNVSYATSMTAEIRIVEYTTTPAWITDVHIDKNIMRSSLPATAKYIWVQAGTNVSVDGNNISDLGSNNPTAIQVSGATINTGLVSPFGVAKNKITGTTSKYSFASNPSLQFEDLLGSAYADIPANIGDGSMTYVSDGKITGGGNQTVIAGGSGCLAWRMRGAWLSLTGVT